MYFQISSNKHAFWHLKQEFTYEEMSKIIPVLLSCFYNYQPPIIYIILYLQNVHRDGYGKGDE